MPIIEYDSQYSLFSTMNVLTIKFVIRYGCFTYVAHSLQFLSVTIKWMAPFIHADT